MNDQKQKLTIDQKFLAFDDNNPEVYQQLRELALRLKRAGRDSYGMAALFETLRFHHALQSNGEEFKLNHNYRALYARQLMAQEPELEGFFRTRRRSPHE